MADPFSAWGPEASPSRLIQRDTLEALNIGSTVQERLGRIAMQPAELRKKELEAEKLQFEMDEERAVRELISRAMSGTPAGAEQAFGDNPEFFGQAAMKPAGMADKLDNVAQVLAGSGRLKKAQDAAKAAADIRAKADEGAKDRTQAVLNELKMVRDQAEDMAQFFGGATDQASWDMANRLYEFQTGQRSPMANVPYSPEVISGLNERALSAKERFDLAEREATRLGTQQYRNSRLRQFDAEQRVREIQAGIAKQREERIAKNSGRGTGGRLPAAEPKKEEIRQVENLILKDFPHAKDFGMELETAAYTISSEARALFRANKAISMSAALNAAYADAVKNKDIESDIGTDVTLGMGLARVGKKFRFAGGGRSPETALALPATKAEAKVGRYYFDPSGRIGKWDGKDMILVPGSNRGGLSNNNRAANREEDEE